MNSLQVRDSNILNCLYKDLEEKIQENQELRKVNAKHNEDYSPRPPYDTYKEAEAAAEEAVQLILESKCRVCRGDEQQGPKTVLQQLNESVKRLAALQQKWLGTLMS